MDKRYKFCKKMKCCPELSRDENGNLIISDTSGKSFINPLTGETEYSIIMSPETFAGFVEDIKKGEVDEFLNS